MLIRLSCPHCDVSLHVPDTAAGKKIRCKECEEPFLVRAAANQAVTTKAPPSLRKPAGKLVAPIEDEEEDEAPAKNGKAKNGKAAGKKKKKQAAGSNTTLIALVGLLAVLAIGGGL